MKRLYPDTKATILLLVLLSVFLGGMVLADSVLVAKDFPPFCVEAGIKGEVVSPYVQVNCDVGEGAGVALDLRGEILVLTCAHMVEDNKYTEDGITFYSPLTLKKHHNKEEIFSSLADVVQVGDSDNGVDLALLHPRSFGLSPARWDPKLKLELGEDCWYIGTPGGVHARLEKSILSHLDREFPCLKGTYLGVNGCANHGSSGGPVFVKRDQHYYLCGVIARGGEDYNNNPKCIGYAVDHTTIKKFLEHYEQKHK